MAEFNEWRAELAGCRLEGQRWVTGRRPSPLPFILAAAGLLLAAAFTTALAFATAHGA